MSNNLRHLDLFSGVGGFALAASMVWGERHQIHAFVEIEPFCQAVLRQHWPGIPIHDDIRTYNHDGSTIDIITGGFPCTQTSVAAAIHNKRDGLNGKDSGLWFEYFRIVQAIRPTWVVVENPGGVKAWESQISGSLEGIGYRVSRLAFTAGDCGLPHIRRRYFYIANCDGQGLEVTRQTGSPTTAWATRLAAYGGDWLTGSPGACGVFNGVPHRVDRVKAIGNSVAPQVAEKCLELIAKQHQ